MDTLFPSPIGELHFSIRDNWIGGDYMNRFRPLSGSYISQFTECHGSKSGMAVSVPYRGATFLNGEPMFTLTGQDRFPSPIGELHFSIEVNNEKTWRAAVSVPYRGATFLNSCSDIVYKKISSFRPLSGSYISQFSVLIAILQNTLVSVPYRGATFLNIDRTFLMLQAQFPSPIGELHFSITGGLAARKQYGNRFRPLSGSYISQ